MRIKRQPFDPPFVLQIGNEEVSARIGRLDESSVIAKIEDRGMYKIDITDVGFWFVEKQARPHAPGRIPPEIRGAILERTMTAVAKGVGRCCAEVASGFRESRRLRDRRG